MDKVSNIVPASTRQVWSSGENEKPRRVTEPNPEEHTRGVVVSSRSSESLPSLASKADQPIVARDTSRGGRLNTMA
jgi:hypothetical protein